jgi:hypothetical protein
MSLVQPRLRNSHSVKDILTGNSWALDNIGVLSVDAIVQHLRLWTPVRDDTLGAGVDIFRWKWTSMGTFSARSAYLAMSEGSIALAAAEH